MKRWYQEEIEYVKQLAKMGVSYTDIAQNLERTAKSVQEKMKKLGFVYNDFYTKPPKALCLNCEGEILNDGLIFCSHSCSATYNNKIRSSKKEPIYCKQCGDSITNKNSSKFCCKSCEQKFKANERKELILKDDNSLPSNAYKKFLIEEYGAKCMECGWDKINPSTNKCPIELEHIDGNSSNNHLNNLKLICPNCHSLTPTYKGLNRGNGRHNRMDRYKSGKSY
jgi:Zn finger protein HypA/HybF involved in hydrogenase expression